MSDGCYEAPWAHAFKNTKPHKERRQAMTIKTIVGKMKIVPAGHKTEDKHGNKVPTYYRDDKGNYHAEFYKGVVGEVVDNMYHSYSFTIPVDEAEAYMNMNLGTTFKVTVRVKTKEEQTLDEHGTPVTQVVDKVTPGKLDKSVLYYECTLEDCEVAKEGKVPRPRPVQLFADVKWTDPEDAEDEGDSDDEG